MISKDDRATLKYVENRWTNFATSRRKREFEYSDNHPLWLTILQREDMLTTLLRILNKYQKKKTETTYEFD